MLSASEKRFSILFIAIVITELICGSISSLVYLHYAFKPAIVLSLLIYFWTQSKTISRTLRYLITAALLCSLLGDILLMFVDAGAHYFLFGLVAFLIAHILYVIAFLKHRNRSIQPFGFIALLLVYASGLFYLLKDGLNEMLVPVLVYMVVILSMSTSAFLRRGNVPSQSYLFVFTGAILFMVSDSILALNKFYMPLAYSNISIMITYALAQYAIVRGLLKLSQSSR